MSPSVHLSVLPEALGKQSTLPWSGGGTGLNWILPATGPWSWPQLLPILVGWPIMSMKHGQEAGVLIRESNAKFAGQAGR